MTNVEHLSPDPEGRIGRVNPYDAIKIPAEDMTFEQLVACDKTFEEIYEKAIATPKYTHPSAADTKVKIPDTGNAGPFFKQMETVKRRLKNKKS